MKIHTCPEPTNLRNKYKNKTKKYRGKKYKNTHLPRIHQLMIQIQKIKHRNTERNIQIHTCPEPTNLRYKYNKLDIIIRLLLKGGFAVQKPLKILALPRLA